VQILAPRFVLWVNGVDGDGLQLYFISFYPRRASDLKSGKRDGSINWRVRQVSPGAWSKKALIVGRRLRSDVIESTQSTSLWRGKHRSLSGGDHPGWYYWRPTTSHRGHQASLSTWLALKGILAVDRCVSVSGFDNPQPASNLWRRSAN